MKCLYFIYQYLVALPLALVATLITALVTLIGCSVGLSRCFGYYPAKIWSQVVCALYLLPVKVEGRENTRPGTSYVFVANHQGAFDIFLVYGFLGHDFRWMMKESLKSIPFVGQACKAAGHVFVNRASLQSIEESINKAHKALQGGKSMVIFPEGTRSLTGQMGRFKKGAFLLADEMQLPVVPLTINGSYEVMPKGRYFISRHRLLLTIHKPILPQGKGEENIKRLAALSSEAIESCLPPAQRSKTAPQNKP